MGTLVLVHLLNVETTLVGMDGSGYKSPTCLRLS